LHLNKVSAVPALESWRLPKYKCEAPGVQGQNLPPNQSPPEAETLLTFGRLLKAANLPTFKKIGNAKSVVFAKK